MPHRHEAAASDMKDENRVLATHFHEKIAQHWVAV
jgi:hypothetical protein